jgi:hypothetical protein
LRRDELSVEDLLDNNLLDQAKLQCAYVAVQVPSSFTQQQDLYHYYAPRHLHFSLDLQHQFELLRATGREEKLGMERWRSSSEQYREARGTRIGSMTPRMRSEPSNSNWLVPLFFELPCPSANFFSSVNQPYDWVQNPNPLKKADGRCFSNKSIRLLQWGHWTSALKLWD